MAFPLLLLLVVSLIVGCNSRPSTSDVDPAFAAYLSSFSSGTLSNRDPIVLRLREAHPQAQAGASLEEEIFSFKPALKGKSFWRDSHTLVFQADEGLPNGALIEVDVALGKLLDLPPKLRRLRFSVQVQNQALEAEFEGLQAYEARQLEWQQVKGRLRSFDYADAEKLEASVSAYQEGRRLPMRWQHREEGTIHQFWIDSVQRGEQTKQISLRWEGAKLGFNAREEQLYSIPPLGEFSLIDLRVEQGEEQSIALFFSDPLDPSQDLEGLIHFEPQSPLRLLREGNSLKIFPHNPLRGSYQLRMEGALRNSLGYTLGESQSREISFASLKPAVALLGEGNILPAAQSLRLPFKAVNLRAVELRIIKVYEDNMLQFLQVNQLDGTQELQRVGRLVYRGEIPLKSEEALDYGRWNSFALDLDQYIKSEPGALYRILLSFGPQHSLYPCASEDQRDWEEEVAYYEELREAQDEQQYFDQSGGYYYYSDRGFQASGRYAYRDRDNPCKAAYYLHHAHGVARNILASNIGLIVHGSADGQFQLAATDLITAEPLPGAEVRFFNLQGKELSRGKTDAQGFWQGSLKAVPFVAMALHQGQRTYLRIDPGSALSMSMFEVGGQKVPEGLKGFIYGERGVWRPGDSIFLSFILEDKQQKLPQGHPLVLELYTPQNQLYLRKLQPHSAKGFYRFPLQTDPTAPTGSWLAKVKVGGSEFSKNLRIETVKPNRLKITLDFDQEPLRADGEAQATLQVHWLHGAVARHLKADVELELQEASQPFPDYPDHAFSDAAKSFKSEGQMLFEGKVDEQGTVKFPVQVKVHEQAPGLLRARLKTRAFESGGEFSVDRGSVLYSPYSSYVGLKIPEGKGWNGALYSDETNIIPLVALSPEGRKVKKRRVRLELYKLHWRWWWDRSESEDLARYVESRSEHLVMDTALVLTDGELPFALKLKKRLYGRQYLRVIDLESGHSAGSTLYFTYRGWQASSNEGAGGGAELLHFKLDKKQYQVGEKIRVSLPSAAKGRSLVSLMTGSQVLKRFWLESDSGQSSFEFEATAAMSPNLYLQISSLQGHGNQANDQAMRLYGVQAISVENPDSRLQPEIIMPDELAPESRFRVKVKESSGKPMTYTLAVVDEGLLDLTRFRTPDPHAHFYAKEALAVRMWDMYRYVISAFSGKLAGLLAVGGDGYQSNNPGAKANRFVPVVKFLGPFSLAGKKSGEHEIEMPNYVGSVRVMVVAGQNGAYGHAEKTVPVKKPLMVLASLPRVLSPGETAQLPVTVFAMDPSVAKVSLKLESNDLLELEQKSGSLQFAQTGEQVLNFRVKSAEKLGVARLKITAQSGREKAHYEIELAVRAPNPRVQSVASALLAPGESKDFSFEGPGMPGTNSAFAELSSLPALNLQHRLQFLIRYPHGCVEQTTSGAFPQLYLSRLLSLSDGQKQEAENHIRSALNRLRSFQTAGGGLAYWPGQSEVNEWGTNYAGHFMVAAQKEGYQLPPGMLSQWLKYQKSAANAFRPESGYLLQQAYRLYTLALAGEAALGPMNRLRSLGNLEPRVQWRLAAAYFLAGQERIGRQMVEQLSTKVPAYENPGYTYGSAQRDQAMILETLTLMGQSKKAFVLLQDLAEDLGSEKWLSTQTTAYSLLAIAQYAGQEKNAGQARFEYQQGNEAPRSQAMSSPYHQMKLSFDREGKGRWKIENSGEQSLFVRLQTSGLPATDQPVPPREEGLLITQRFLALDGEEIDPAKIEQGQDFWAVVEVQHQGLREAYREMVLSQIFPSGWEIRNLRLDEMGSNSMGDAPDYRDQRDDRVLTYFSLPKGGKKTFKLMLNASYQGRYFLPALQCEAMYDHSIFAQIPGRWVEVVPAGQASPSGS